MLMGSGWDTHASSSMGLCSCLSQTRYEVEEHVRIKPPSNRGWLIMPLLPVVAPPRLPIRPPTLGRQHPAKGGGGGQGTGDPFPRECRFPFPVRTSSSCAQYCGGTHRGIIAWMVSSASSSLPDSTNCLRQEARCERKSDQPHGTSSINRCGCVHF
jgi:hypothetical protein